MPASAATSLECKSDEQREHAMEVVRMANAKLESMTTENDQLKVKLAETVVEVGTVCSLATCRN